MKILPQATLIIGACALVFLINNTSLQDYQVQAFALVVSIWVGSLLIQKFLKKGDFFTGSYFDLFCIILSLLLLIFITGGLPSPIFFLVYFLLFAVTFMLEPFIIFVFTAALLVLFSQEFFQQDLFFNILRLGSLLLLSPLAFLFGLENKKREKLDNKIQSDTQKIIEDTQDLLTNADSKTRETVVEIQEIAKKMSKSVGKRK